MFVSFVGTVLKMFASCSFSVAQIFDGILSCKTFISCVNAATIALDFVYVVTVM